CAPWQHVDDAPCGVCGSPSTVRRASFPPGRFRPCLAGSLLAAPSCCLGLVDLKPRTAFQTVCLALPFFGPRPIDLERDGVGPEPRGRATGPLLVTHLTGARYRRAEAVNAFRRGQGQRS